MAALSTPHPAPLQAAYSELKRLAREQTTILIGSPGAVVERLVKGRSFLYRDYYAPGGKKAADYLGASDDPEATARADATREAIGLANDLLDQSRLLAQQGYVRVDGRTDAILAALANNGLFHAGALLVGSHAYGALLNELGVAASAVKTEDVDVARDRALELGSTAKPFARMLEDSKVPLFEIPQLDLKAPSTSFSTRGRDPLGKLRVDLLVPTDGNVVKTLEARELGAHATALPWLRYLLQGPLPAIVIGRSAVVPVNVPRPELFACHKMLVSELRHDTSEKRSKDVEQATVIVATLAQQAPESLEEAFRALPRAAKSKAERGARRVLARLDAAGLVAARDLVDAMASGG